MTMHEQVEFIKSESMDELYPTQSSLMSMIPVPHELTRSTSLNGNIKLVSIGNKASSLQSHSLVYEDENVASPSDSVTPPFVSKLVNMLKNKEFYEFVSWNSEGDAVLIKKVSEFSSTVLPRYFKHKNFTSFLRQLNMYGFITARQGANWREFRNELFTKHRPETYCRIKRKQAQIQPHNFGHHVKSEATKSTKSGKSINSDNDNSNNSEATHFSHNNHNNTSNLSHNSHNQHSVVHNTPILLTATTTTNNGNASGVGGGGGSNNLNLRKRKKEEVKTIKQKEEAIHKLCRITDTNAEKIEYLESRVSYLEQTVNSLVQKMNNMTPQFSNSNTNYNSSNNNNNNTTATRRRSSNSEQSNGSPESLGSLSAIVDAQNGNAMFSSLSRGRTYSDTFVNITGADADCVSILSENGVNLLKKQRSPTALSGYLLNSQSSSYCGNNVNDVSYTQMYANATSNSHIQRYQSFMSDLATIQNNNNNSNNNSNGQQGDNRGSRDRNDTVDQVYKQFAQSSSRSNVNTSASRPGKQISHELHVQNLQNYQQQQHPHNTRHKSRSKLSKQQRKHKVNALNKHSNQPPISNGSTSSKGNVFDMSRIQNTIMHTNSDSTMHTNQNTSPQAHFQNSNNFVESTKLNKRDKKSRKLLHRMSNNFSDMDISSMFDDPRLKELTSVQEDEDLGDLEETQQGEDMQGDIMENNDDELDDLAVEENEEL